MLADAPAGNGGGALPPLGLIPTPGSFGQRLAALVTVGLTMTFHTARLPRDPIKDLARFVDPQLAAELGLREHAVENALVIGPRAGQGDLDRRGIDMVLGQRSVVEQPGHLDPRAHGGERLGQRVAVDLDVHFCEHRGRELHGRFLGSQPTGQVSPSEPARRDPQHERLALQLFGTQHEAIRTQQDRQAGAGRQAA